MLVCGGESEEARRLYRRHATDWFEYHLRCDVSYRSWVDGADVLAEEMAGLLTFFGEGLGEPCLPPAPGPVTGLRVERLGQDLRLSWDPMPPEPPVTAFRVYEARSFDFAASEAVAEPVDPELSLPGIARDRTMRAWRVRAFGPGGERP